MSDRISDLEARIAAVEAQLAHLTGMVEQATTAEAVIRRARFGPVPAPILAKLRRHLHAVDGETP